MKGDSWGGALPVAKLIEGRAPPYQMFLKSIMGKFVNVDDLL